MFHTQRAARRTAATGLLAAAILALVGTTAARADTEPGSDPIFGDGCRYVAVDTPTDIDPHATVCRPV